MAASLERVDGYLVEDREGADLQCDYARASYGTAVLKIALVPSVNCSW
jgi:hypothetical protein